MPVSGNGSIAGRAYYDADGDDRFGSGDYAAANFPINVQLTDGGGQVVAATVTGADGLYALHDIPDGVYTLAFSVQSTPFPFTPSTPADAQRTVTIVDGGAVTGADAAFILPATITGTAYGDANGNGLLDTGEAPIAGETVRLFDGHGQVVATTTTGSNGVYSFANLHPGVFAVSFTAPAGEVSTSSTTVNLGTVLSNATVTTNSGLVAAADSVTLSGSAFADADGNGRRGAGEAGMPGVNVMLVRDAGTATATVVRASTTDAAGHYVFAGLSAGDYSIVFATPSGDVITGPSTLRPGPLTAGQSSVADAGFAADPTPDAGALPAATTVNIILRGQSNATYFTSDGYLTQLKAGVEHMLGFDGIHQTVNFVADFSNFAGPGINTLNPGTGMIRDWLSPIDGDYRNGWTAKPLEIGLLTDVERRAPTLSAGQTMILWLHNESDSLVSGLTTDQWMSAARYETGLVRGALGKGADAVPLLFVNAIPFPASGVTQESSDFANQNIRIGMATLAADKTFNAAIVAQLSDVTMDRDGHVINGAHLDAADNAQLLARLTLSLAKTLAASALPGSPVALDGGQFDSLGPQVVSATAIDGHPDQLLLTIAQDHASGFDGLGAAAASGVGWSVRTTATGDGSVLLATGTAVTVVNGTHLLVTFDAGVPAGGKLFYAWGDHRLAADPTLPGNGNAVYDSNHLPIWANANGVGLTVAPAGTGSISGTVFGDANGNDALDASDGDAGFQGYTVLLKDAGGTTIAAATSDANGTYGFGGLADGTYSVEFADTSQGVFPTAVPSAHSVTVAGGQAAPNVDAGFYQGGAIYGFGFADANHNGTFDVGEGIDGETVELLDGSGHVVATTTTSGSNPALPVDGGYVFQGLPEGAYTVRFTQPTGTTLTTPATVPVPLARSQDVEVDSGIQVNTGRITGTVFTDTDGNGAQSASEAGLAGIAITLKDASGHAVGTATSDAGGHYAFAGIAPGTYGVSIAPSAGRAADPFAVTVGSDAVTGQDIGVYTAQPIAGFVYDANSTATDGIAVDLYDAGGTFIASVTTGPFGSFPHGVFLFDPVRPGTYTLEAVDPHSTSQSRPQTTTVRPDGPDYGQSIMLLPARPSAPGSIAGIAFDDVDGDGVPGTGEPALPDVVVTLTDAHGAIVASARTDANGAYHFADLAAGTYHTRFSGTPYGLVAAPTSVTVAAGIAEVDGALSNPVFIRGIAFVDDGSHLYTGEPGVNGVTVTLIDATGGVVATTTTTTEAGQDGVYQFGGILPGSYSVQFTPPAGRSSTTSSTIALGRLAPGTVGEADLGLGGVGTGSIAGTVFTDANGDGAPNGGEAGISGVTVTLTDMAGGTAHATSDAQGRYAFANLHDGAYRVSFTTPAGVFAENSAPHPISVTGGSATTGVDAGFFKAATISGIVSLAAGATALDGVVVALIDANGSVIATTASGVVLDPGYAFSIHGFYAFTNVEPGTYTVRAQIEDAAVAPAPSADIVATSGQTATTNIALRSAAHLGADTIAGTVFVDANGNGVNDGEAALANVAVTVTDGAGTVVATTTTGADGHYAVSGLSNGRYAVSFSNQAGLASAPDGVRLSTAQPGATADGVFFTPGTISGVVFGDGDGNGLRDGGDAGVAGAVVRLIDGHGTTVGATTTNAAGTYGFANVQAGMYSVQFATPAGSVATTPTTVVLAPLAAGATVTANAGVHAVSGQISLSGTAFLDTDGDGVRDHGEAGLARAAVVLVDSRGNAVQTAVTDANGHYGFASVANGAYSVTFGVPDGDHATTATTVPVGIVAAGQTLAGLDAGFAAGAAAPAALPAATTLNIILRGQSNSQYFTQEGMLAKLQADLEGMLGFDGVHQRVNVLPVFYSGTALVGDWLQPIGGDYRNGWQASPLELGLLSAIGQQSPDIKSAQTAVVWLHNETDSVRNPAITPEQWASAVQFEASLVRGVLGQSAAALPYLFVDAIPFPSNGTLNGTNPPPPSTQAVQAIRVGMAQLAGDPTFNGRVIAHSSDVNMDANLLGAHGGAHMDLQDGEQLEQRLTLSLANEFASSARPGSPIAQAGGHVDSAGPQVVAAATVAGHADQLLITVSDDPGIGLGALGAGAAQGLGWSLRHDALADPALLASATYVKVVDPAHLLVTFDHDVPTAAKLFYGWGSARIAPDDQPGIGNAVTDTNKLPIWANPNGVAVTDARVAAPQTTGSISGTVFYDANGNNAIDPSDGDAVLPGYTVTLQDAGGTPVATATSDAQGHYTFGDLADGSYTVAFQNAATGLLPSVAPGTHGVTVAGGQATSNVDAGLYLGGAIYGYGYADADGDGAFTSGEGISGETVELLDDHGRVLATTTTSESNPAVPADGVYVFQGLTDGSYALRFTPPAGSTLTTPDTVPVTLTKGQLVEVDSGLHVYSGAITGTTFTDTDGNGARNGSEAGLAGIAVALKDANGGTVGTAMSDAQGHYAFTGVAPGTYTVSVAPQGGQVAEASPTVAVGTQSVTGQDIGLFAPEPIAGFVRGGGANPVDGVPVLLFDAGGHLLASTASAPNPSFPHGVYQFSNLKPGAYTVEAISGGHATSIATRVTSGNADYGQDIQIPAAAPSATATVFGFAYTDANGNGLFEPGEGLVDGERVELLNHDRDPVASTTTGPTASLSAISGLDGAYSFTGVTPGAYTLRFTAPDGQQLTTAVLQSLGTLAAGQTVSVNSGLVSSAGTITVSGNAFDDTDGDGHQGSREPGHAGVNVLLVKDAGTNTAVAVKTAVTDIGGHYTFGALAAGTYSVVFATPSGSDHTSPTTVAAGALVTGHSATADFGLHAQTAPSTVAPIAPATVLNVIVRGQSNAQNFSGGQGGDAIGVMKTQLEHLLGFDGVNQRVNILADYGKSDGANTINSGTALLTDWLQPIDGDYHNGWSAKSLELGLLTDVAQQSAAFRSAPTAVVWLHNESDSLNPNVTTDAWTSAARFEAGLLRGVLGQDAATVPYLFVNAIPFGGNDSSEQAIRIGMSQLAGDPAFDGRIAAQLSDIAEDEFGTPPLGGHIDYADRQLLAGRLAASLAQTFASSALPGSPVALAQGQVDDKGPQVVEARKVAGHANQLVVTVQHDAASGFEALNTAAATGAGWTIRNGAVGDASALKASATAAEVVDATHLRLTFDHDVSADGRLFYAWGTGLIAQPGQSGFGNAVYDAQHLPIWADPNGVGVVSGANVVGVSVSGTGISASGAGHLRAGATVAIAVSLDAPVTVDTAHGSPTLALSDGATATYTGGSGTTTLTFTTTVAPGQNSTDLTVTGLDLHGATVRDAGGSDAVLTGATANPAGVLVIDTGKPTLALHAPSATVEAVSALGATVTFDGSATDAIDGTDAVAFAEGGGAVVSGQRFALGHHTIVATATDAAGNPADPVSFGFTVVDTTKPTLTVTAPPATIEAASTAGASVTLRGTASDAVDGTDAVVFREGTRVVASGDTFGIGSHTITASAHDAAGNVATPIDFAFTVAAPTQPPADTGKPVLAVLKPAPTIEATSAAGASVTFAGAAADAVDGSDPVAFHEGTTIVVSGQTFALGAHTVTATATDAAGNAADPVGFSFTVGDATKPVIGVISPPAAVAAASSAGASVAFSVSATDRVDGTDAVTFTEGSRVVASGDTFAIGAHTLTASAHDRAGNVADPVAITFTVTGDRAPHAVEDTGPAQAHASVAGNLLANDGDPDAGDHLALTTIHYANAAGVAVAAGAGVTLTSDHGHLTIAADGRYGFIADRAGGLAAGQTAVDAFTYTVSDDHGATDTGHLSITVTGAAQVASETFAFAFTDARVAFQDGSAVLTGPDGVAHDVTGIGTLTFIDGTIQEKDGAPLVDDLYYDAHNLDVWRAHADPDAHYATFGWHEGRDPSAVFATNAYLAANPDAARAGVDPLQHYDAFGWHEGRTAGPGFSGDAYLAANPDVAGAGIDPLLHYLTFGGAEGRSPFPGQTNAHMQGDFDAAYYLAHNPDVAAAVPAGGNADIVALRHYLAFGAAEGRDPDAYFSTTGYLAANPDVAAAHANPLLHYEAYGWQEGRDPGPGFHGAAYLAANPDVAAAHIDPLQHFLQFGQAEGRHAV